MTLSLGCYNYDISLLAPSPSCMRAPPSVPLQPSSAASKPALDKLVSHLLTDEDLLEVALNSGEGETGSLL